MKKLDSSDPETRSSDLVADNLARLKELFPEAWSEGKIDFDVLRQLLGSNVAEGEEKYGLNWHGKRRARQIALTPSTGTLRPCPEESLEWDTTQNLMIEGDNLEVLKLLQKAYAGNVKMIYIDPPYNTGNDFIYPDDFRDTIGNYLRLTGQLALEGGANTSSIETTGRFHTVWLNMIYPRLKLARSLLREDGVLFVSIDDAEQANLRTICNEIFGEENFLACFVRRRRMATGMRSNPVSPDHEYVVAYAKDLSAVRLYGTSQSVEDYPHEDAGGRYRSTDLSIGMTREMRPNQFYSIVHPTTGVEYWPPPQRVWRFEPTTMAEQIRKDRVLWPDDNPTGRMTRPRFKTRFEGDAQNGRESPISTWMETKTKRGGQTKNSGTLTAGLNQEGTRELRALLDDQVLEYPKPVSLIRSLCALASRGDDIVLDFFGGSGTTGHAVWSQNRRDGGSRRFILVQLPEPTGRSDYATISAVTLERLRRAARALRHDNELIPLDLGFRVFRLSTSNIRVWESPSAEAELGELLRDSVTRLDGERSDGDVLYELLLKFGIDLCVPVEQRAFSGKVVHRVDGGRLVACLATSIDRDEVEGLATGILEWVSPELRGNVVCVFRDSAFEDDVSKANLAAILEQHGIVNIRSL